MYSVCKCSKVKVLKFCFRLIGCSLDVQNMFLDAWSFYLDYFKSESTQDNGVIG